ncbi:hypothetical protein NP493_764g00021 [Ridgeia piscesae]|uniref:Uncharacterized protein n=2 Tax=Ridgeia piscesae TaxID=27915 RepID=A0AAD9KPB0_RIDPI|nr:hypothetical protein NP493_764g00021 [Ridgeia piscesae]
MHLCSQSLNQVSGYRDAYDTSDVTDLNNATCQQVTTRESDKGFTLKVELSLAVRSRLTVTAVVDEGDCLDFPATMVYTEGDQSAMLPYHNNPSFCDNTPGQCVFECDCSDTECVTIRLVIISAPDHSRKLFEVFIM